MEALEQLLSEMGAYDPYTAAHGSRVARYAEQIGRALGLPEDALREVGAAGLLHDIGKLWVPIHILRKPAPLDDGEVEIMRRHAGYGAEILTRVHQPGCAALVGQHHERIDGLGYPNGRRGQEIHLFARIVSVADVYDAMTTDRDYRRALGRADAVAELERVAGTQLDSRLVGTFLETLSRERARDHRRFERRP